MGPVIPGQEMRTFLGLLRFQQESCRVNVVQEATENANPHEELRKGFPSQDPAPVLKGEHPGGEPPRGQAAPSAAWRQGAWGRQGGPGLPSWVPHPGDFFPAATKAACSQVTGANLPWGPGAEQDRPGNTRPTGSRILTIPAAAGCAAVTGFPSTCLTSGSRLPVLHGGCRGQHRATTGTPCPLTSLQGQNLVQMQEYRLCAATERLDSLNHPTRF